MPAAEPYYLDNFRSALDWIGRRYDDLLDERERAFIAGFDALPLPSRALLVRMLMRQGVHFRASKLQYDEIGCPMAAAGPLLSHGWLDADPVLSLTSLFALSTRPQLLRLLPELSSMSGRGKAEWLAALTPCYPAEQAYSDWTSGRDETDRLYHVTIAPLCERLRLIFFGNLHQDWSAFVLADLGIFQYETVVFPGNARAFQLREDVDAYLDLQRSREALHAPDGLASEDALLSVVTALVAVSTRNPWIAQRRAKCLFLAGQAAERMHYWDGALAAYAQTDWPGARHRTMRVMERCGREVEALALAAEAVHAPESEEEAQRVGRLRTRLLKRLSIAPATSQSDASAAAEAGQADASSWAKTRVALASPISRPTPISRGVLDLPPNADIVDENGDRASAQGSSVEFRVRDALSVPEAPVFYVENTLLAGLFGLLCWDAVFAPLPGAFFHPFQRGPADLDAPDFVMRRRALFDAALDRLDDRRYRRQILTQWRMKYGIQSPFVHWGALRRDVVLLALRCIPAMHLKHCFQRLLADPRANRTGLPDLIRFRPRQRDYEMIEVKGPGDRLQDNQLRWLGFFAAHGIPARVLDVRWHQEAAPLPVGVDDGVNDGMDDARFAAAPHRVLTQ
ncbi:VRR-NUC domain-containing protein [Robbsia sp. KACC 23696]|uniref:VRR-NUC domain-containing protein n=1 Tax=Robbsia sp. KACC 23696 TaxID=3149231 RepID=UPI00325AAACC